jgi:ABC-type nitrate/sulfonate/bicarbonate transport system ATPase subunit
VWVTHDPREAAAVADRTLLMGGPPAGRVRLVEHADPSDGVDLPRRLVEALGELSYLKE